MILEVLLPSQLPAFEMDHFSGCPCDRDGAAPLHSSYCATPRLATRHVTLKGDEKKGTWKECT